MIRFGKRSSAGQGLASWPVLLCLALGVLTPSAALLWFMNRAVQNEQLAVRQKLIDAYDVQVGFHAARIPAFWTGRVGEVRRVAGTLSSAELFEHVVKYSLADGLIVRDSDGQTSYPDSSRYVAGEPDIPGWREATRAAANETVFLEIAARETSVSHRALALQAAARAARGAGRTNEALRILLLLGETEFETAQDGQGRLLAASADLAALELLPRTDPRFNEIGARLRGRLGYDNPRMSSLQRRFLASELAGLTGDRSLDPLLAAEQFTARALSRIEPKSGGLRVDPAADLVSFQVDHLVLLFRASRLNAELENILMESAPPGGIELVILDQTAQMQGFVASSPIEGMPAWKLAARPQNPEEFDRLARRQIAFYIWVGIIVVAVVTIISLFAARGLVRQMRMARLKNDLVANVTHELKTPLASTRLLVETLLDSPRVTDSTTREYLELIARENRRLGSLIENFLVFSRMERNKFSFDFEVKPGAEIVSQAAEAVRDKFAFGACEFSVECPVDLPAARGDADSLATAIINLLENAYKYTGEPKRIILRGRSEGDRVIFEVQDNGIGIPARHLKKIFRRFYQVDQSLSRATGGCGLGLSIVDFIVTAHGGRIAVQSVPGKGSTFSISLPAAGATLDLKEEAAAA
jgi:signal transduction histidine kinase